MGENMLCFSLLLFANCLSLSVSDSSVPVLLWESKSTGEQFRPIPALAQYEADEFLNHFLKKIKALHSKPLVVVFLEDTLSLEDFSWQDSSKKEAFPNVKKCVDHAKGIEFLPAVKCAEDAFQKIEGYGYIHKELEDLQNDEKGVVSVVSLDDAKPGEDRADMLNRHDMLIADVLKKLTDSQSNFISVLTGKEASWISLSRVRRALDGNETLDTNEFVFNASGKVLLQTPTAPILTVDGVETKLPSKHSDQLDSRSGNALRLISTFTGDKNKIILRFKFELSSGYWSLTQVDYTFDTKEGSLLPTTPIRAERGFSYLNPGSAEFVNENKTAVLRFGSLKTQAWTSGKFDQAESKIGFFTIPIWTGILIIGMLSFIMVWGLIMVMDIKTMDQFDDPKGKTISINASE